MKIITWNLDFWKRTTEQRKLAWDYLYKTINPDIALIQETVEPAKNNNGYHTLYNEIGGTRKWGNVILTKKEIKKEIKISNIYPGSTALQVVEIELADKTLFTAINIYGLIDNDTYATTTMHHILSDLTRIIDKSYKRNIILGGDFNVSEQVDTQYKGKYPSHKLIFDRLENFGLINCTKKFFKGHVQTHVHSKSKVKWQNDYIFVSKNLIDKVKSCEVINEKGLLDYSDHYPVVVEML